MRSSSERRQQLDTIYEQYLDAVVILAECAAALALVVLLVVTVVSDGRVMDGTALQGMIPSRAAAAVNAKVHRKQVFDERRQRFQGNAERLSIASEAVEPDTQSQVVQR